MKSLLVTLAIIFYLLMSNIANAQCAWVLWERQHLTNEEGQVVNPGQWGIVSAYPKYEQCLERQKQAFLNFKEEQGFKVILRPFEHALKYKEGGKVAILQELKCLPDTIDPRK